MYSREEITRALKENFGFDSFKGNQLDIIASLMDGYDTFVLMPTGGGKSLCYQLPALLMDGTAIVISPLIALMKNQVDAMRQFSENDEIAAFLNSSLTKAAVDKVKADVKEGKTKLLYVAPESLGKEENIEFLKGVKISFYAIDEAHCISEWGHDFRPEYRRLRPVINEIGSQPVVALTATATPKVQHDIKKNLGMLDAKVFKSSFNRSNLYYEVRQKTDNVDRDMIRFIKNRPGKSGIIYCLSRKKVEEVSELLILNGIRALPYHAGLDSSQRAANQDAFINENVDVVVATIAFGMGIDKPDVRFVIHYDIPKSLEGYYQETGRSGRDGGEGHCLAFYSVKDLKKMEKFMQGKKNISDQEIGKQLLAETASYAESNVCRRRQLLHYFGEVYEIENCGNCDNCLNPTKKVEAKDDLCAVIETVSALKQCYKAQSLADILIGRDTIEIESAKLNELETFGTMPKSDDRYLLSLIRQATIAGYLDKDIENYGAIKLTEKGREFLKNPVSFKLTLDNEYNESEEPEELKAGASCAADTELYSILKDLRRKVAKQLDLPPYVIFQEPSLEAMATTYPVTMEELQKVPGVGVGKAKRYGEEFLNVIRRHVEENEIERPEDMVVRVPVSKNNAKAAIVQSLDRRISLEHIAETRDIDFETLLDEIESIIASGTFVDISYYINEILDKEQQQEIFDFFKSSETGSVKDAYDEFDGDYTEEELRLMRIKFMSDMSN